MINPSEPKRAKNINSAKDNADIKYKLLAKTNPDEFLLLLDQNDLDYFNLILTIEASIYIEDRRKVIPILFKYIYHDVPSVKEAAIYVLSSKMTKKIKKEFIKAEAIEKNEAIRALLSSLI